MDTTTATGPLAEEDQAAGNGEIARARRGLAALTALKELDGPPTEEQRAALAGWSGWGPLAKAFGQYHEPGSTWRKLQTAVLDVLTEEEEAAAKLAVDTAFYTTPAVARSIWSILTGLGVTGGRVLEPGCGSGSFIAATPAGLPVDWTGVEADPVTAEIAATLHPAARIVPGRLEKTALRRGLFDAVVGNVPFSKSGPYDAAAPTRFSLHNYFIWRALCATRPGGLVALITSRYTLDSAHPAQRAAIADLGDLVAAVRLPSAAFTSLGTSVVADLLVLRRRDPGAEPPDYQLWLQDLVDSPAGVKVNPYWLANPGMVLGEMRARDGHQYGMTLEVATPPGADLNGVLLAAVARVTVAGRKAGLAWQPPAAGEAVELDADALEAAGRDRSFALAADGTVMQLVDGSWVKVRANAELVSLIRLRDAAVALFSAEADPSMAADDRGAIRSAARAAYKAYVAEFGPLNRCTLSNGKPDEDGQPTKVRRRPTMGGFRQDPDYPTVLALELWDDETSTASPAPILLRHVNQAPARKTSTDDPAEALLLCLDAVGRVDLAAIARLLSTEPAEVPGLLAGQVWQDPTSAEWVTTDEYLSGNVRVKLAEAKAAAERDADRWAGNVTALEEVQPADLGPDEISAQLGSPWVPPADVEAFICDLLGVHRNGGWEGSVKVRFEPHTSAWEVKGNTAIRQQPAATATWGTLRVNAVNLIEDALNGTSPTVYDVVGTGSDAVRVRNNAETALAADKIRDLQERFAAWVWEDHKRSDRLCLVYNERFNSTRLRCYDGSLLTFPGLAGDFTPYQSQRDMAWRIACTPAALCGFSVGSGKTAGMILSAFLLRRLGLARKPVMVVPNHLLEQETADARRLYPGGRILMVTKEDLTRERRKTFLAKVAARDWDLIVMTHQQFGAIPCSPDTQAAYLAGLIEELEMATMGDGLEDCRTVKKLAAMKKKLIARHEELLDAPRDDGLTWEQTGIDFVLVDEAHLFKNLALSSRAEGFSLSGSKRADDLAMKLNWLRDRSPDGRSGALFTGTPLSNSLAELYVMLRYLAPHLLAERGLDSFDAFAAQFIRYVTATEVAPDGSGFRQYRRPMKYTNLPELRLLLGEVADIRTRADLRLAGPAVTSEHVAVEASEALSEFTGHLVDRADRIRNGGVRPDEDNMLAICTDGRRAALDLRLVGFEPDAPGKIEAVAANVAAIYHANAAALYPDPTGGSLFADRPGALQIVFCDQGTPNPERGDQVYGRIRDGLTGLGVPRERIAFIHDAKTDLDKAALFARCRDGQVSVLLGSTEKCGTGVNVQHRCAAIHHVDAPWRPADVEQREGRGNRPGNEHGKLHVVRYVTEGSFDAYMWQGLERKQRFISQILTGALDTREIEDAGNPAVLTFAEMKAIATGQPLLLEQAEVNAKIARLYNQASAHKRTQNRMRSDYALRLETARAQDEKAGALRALGELAAAGPRVLAGYCSNVEDADEVAALLAEYILTARENRHDNHPGRWRDVEITLKAEKRYHGKKPGNVLSVTLSPRYSARWASHQFYASGNVWQVGAGKVLLTQIDEALDGAEALAVVAEERAAHARQQAADIKPYLGQAFPHEDELAACQQRRREIEALIDAEVKRPEPEQAEEVAAA